MALAGLFNGLGRDEGLDGDSTAVPGRLAVPSDGTLGSFLPLPGFVAEVLAFETPCLDACSFNEAHLSFSSSSFFFFLSSNAALRSSFFRRLSSACFSRRSFTLFCLGSRPGPNRSPAKFSADADRLDELFWLALACGELEREAEGIDAFDNAFLELLAVGLSKVEGEATIKIKEAGVYF